MSHLFNHKFNNDIYYVKIINVYLFKINKLIIKTLFRQTLNFNYNKLPSSFNKNT
jgi:hypothetical protein